MSDIYICMKKKKCRDCGLTKLLKDFCWNSKKRKLRFPYCKACHIIRNRAYYKSHRKKILARCKILNKSIHRRFNSARAKAKNYSQSWSITERQYTLLITQPCYYCNNNLDRPVENGIGLDRLDNNKGYDIDNIVSCCKMCNYIKGIFISHIEMKEVAKLLIALRASPL
jgi:hypothetical protein